MVTLNVIPVQLFRTGANTRGRTFKDLLSCNCCDEVGCDRTFWGTDWKISSLSSNSTRLRELFTCDFENDCDGVLWFSPTLDDKMDEIFLFLDADNRLASLGMTFCR